MRTPEIFPGRTDIAVINDVERRADCEAVFKVLKSVAWSSPKTGGHGIPGIVFCGLYVKRKYYPTLRDEEAVNPDGSQLR